MDILDADGETLHIEKLNDTQRDMIQRKIFREAISRYFTESLFLFTTRSAKYEEGLYLKNFINNSIEVFHPLYGEIELPKNLTEVENITIDLINKMRDQENEFFLANSTQVGIIAQHNLDNFLEKFAAQCKEYEKTKEQYYTNIHTILVSTNLMVKFMQSEKIESVMLNTNTENLGLFVACVFIDNVKVAILSPYYTVSKNVIPDNRIYAFKDLASIELNRKHNNTWDSLVTTISFAENSNVKSFDYYEYTENLS